MKTGDAIAEILKREGVEWIIGYPVNHILEHGAAAGIRPIVGLQLFEGWRENGPRKWRGTIYDPDRGSNFNVSIALAGDRLVVTGCIVWGCESETWIRYRDQ